MLGTSETIGTFSDLFTIVDKRNKIYVRNETYTRPEMEFKPSAHPAQEEGGKSRLKGEVLTFNLQKTGG